MSDRKLPAHFLPIGRVSHYVLALVALVACLLSMGISGRIGIARLLAIYGLTSNAPLAVNEAVRISPSDPEVHYTRARVLQNAGQVAAAVPELEQATALQPRNYGFWLELGGAYDLVGKPEAAIAAVTRAIKLAPAYAQPHWQLGNLLLRAGRPTEAFAEFQLAVNSDSSLTPNVVDLAWGAFQGDAQKIEQTLQPHTPVARLELARVFAMRGAVDEAMRLFRSTENSIQTKRERENLLAELMKAKHYYEAWEVWAVGRNIKASSGKNGIGTITDGSFEQEISATETNFGWRINPEKPTVSVVVDAQERYADAASLQIRWEGKSSPSAYTVAQLVLVEPGKHYRLSFAARAKDLVTGGLPEVVVLSDYEGQLLATAAIPQGTSSWQQYSIDFSAPAASHSVLVVIRRKGCAVMPCPVFGTVWFDAFSLRSTI
jgi:Tfp pilus assembly protein PilF